MPNRPALSKLFGDTPLLFLLLAALTARVIVALSPAEFLLQQVIPDDAFYYFTIARNFVRGDGLTFDGLTPTNGYHPLWMALTIPIFALIHDPSVSLHAVLLLCAIIDTASLFFLFRVLGDLAIASWLRMVTCLLYALSPMAIMSILGPMNGLETSINTLALIVCFRMYLGMNTRLSQGSQVSSGTALAFGGLGGLAFLCRTDNIILLAALWLFLAFKHGRTRETWGNMLISAVAGLLLVSPWLVYSYLTFGSMVQVSGQSVALMERNSFAAAGAGTLDYVAQFGSNLLNMLKQIAGFRFPRSPVETALTIGCIGLFAFSVVSMLRQRGAAFSLRKPVPLADHISIWLPVVLSSIAFVAVHTLRAVYMRPWYYYSFVMLLLVVVAVLVQYLSTSLQANNVRGRPVYLSLIVLLLGLQTVAALRLRADHAGVVKEWRKIAVIKKINELVPPRATVGSWNAGVLGYNYSKGRVVNLDGSVNNAAFRFIKDFSLERYARSVSIEYVVDDTTTVRSWSPFWRPDGAGIYMSLAPVDTVYDIMIARLTTLEDENNSSR